MRRFGLPTLITGSLIALVVACFGDALFRDGQFAYRDAGHFYYPLYHRVQREWDAGRWPLWDPDENGGMPLLGNPTAAVLYPGKVIYAALPYAWGARLYTIAHVLLAFGAMAALVRHWGGSAAASAIAGLSYAFGVPVLFQYANIIYLVGAAWSPLGLLGADRWLRQGRRGGLLLLSVTTAMQVLGGEPQSAYLVGLCAGGYALGLARGRAQQTSPRAASRRWLIPTLIVGLALWTGLTLAAATWFPTFRAKRLPVPVLPWVPWIPRIVLGLWGVVGLVVIHRWIRGRDRGLRTMLLGLAGAAGLAALLSAAQLLPVSEFTSQTVRAADEGPHDIYPFSLEPTRLFEFLWPNVFGTPFGGNSLWITYLPPALGHPEIWTPSLYIGGLTVVLGLAGAGVRRGREPWVRWFTLIAAISLVAGLGEFAGPLWWARQIPALQQWVGPPDQPNATPIRLDGQLRDGDGSVYWFMATVLPLFQSFRYPAKLVGFTSLALSALAGIGWDRLTAGRAPRARRLSLGFLILSLVALVLALLGRDSFIAWLKSASQSGAGGVFGPLDVDGAYRAMAFGLLHGAVVMALTTWLALSGRKRPAMATVVALMTLTVDLALANARFIATQPQSTFERTPKVLKLIEAAERANPSGAPYRIHRVPLWDPLIWRLKPSTDRVGDFVRWEHDTLQPKYGLLHGVSYTMTIGVAELYDLEFFFSSFFRTPTADGARMLNIEPGKQVIYYCRRGFDMWNTRYFVLPVYPGNWTDEFRGYASFLYSAEAVYPRPGAFQGPGGDERRRNWAESEDYQVLRNLNEMPRSWVVHEGRFYKPIRGLAREDRQGVMQEMLYAGDPLWYDETRRVYDPRIVAWFDQRDAPDLERFLPRTPFDSNESIRFVDYQPQRVEMEVSLQRPGVVVLADVFYPGWTLTIDGAPAPVYRTNRLMRGAAVPSGTHRLVYTYDPGSFRIGGLLSLSGLLALAILAVYVLRSPLSPTLAGPRISPAVP